MKSHVIGASLFLVVQLLALTPALAVSTASGMPAELTSIKERIDKPGHPPLSDKDWNDTIKTLIGIIEKKPTLAEAYYLRAIAYDATDDKPQSLADLNECLKLDPNHARALWMRGISVFMSGKFNEALADFNLAIDKGERTASLYANRGAAYQQLNEEKKAVQDFDTSVNLDPKPWTTRIMRVGSNKILGNYEQVISDCDYILTVKSAPKDVVASAYKERGAALYHLGKYETAIESLSKAADLMEGKQKAKAVYLRGACYNKLGQKDKAQADLELAHQLGFVETGSPAASKAIPESVEAKDTGLSAAVKELMEKAKQSLPQVKARYQKGLPAGQQLHILTPIYDTSQVPEHVFVKVISWNGDKIVGTISNDVRIQGYKKGDQIDLPQADVEDWTILSADGSEEGNLVGKYLDTLK